MVTGGLSNNRMGLNNANKISGFGIRRRHYTTRTTGRGVGRRVIGSLIVSVGHALENRISSAVRGGSHKLTGMGRRRVGRPRKPREHLSIKNILNIFQELQLQQSSNIKFYK